MADMQANFSRKNLYLFELSDVFDNQVYLPYSTGVVASYVFLNETIKQSYNLSDWFYYRQSAEEILDKIKDPDVVGFSCFIWNWNLNLQLASLIKQKFPSCTIVFGGQQQPLADRVGDFFERHQFVDILVHGEGEQTFQEILLEKLKLVPNFSRVNGITYNDRKDKVVRKTEERIRMKDITTNPSPYLDGMFDRLIESKPEHLSYSAIVESARGCPYHCAFCEIGEQYYSKVEKNYDKIKQEIDWVINNKIEYVTDANSNFGMYYDLDLDLAKYVKSRKEETGYPHAYRVTWAKGRADKVLDIAKVFEVAKVQKGVTIALQSMNPKVLDAVKRKNIDGGKLKEFIEMYESQNISSYVELIWGLPDETLESFVDGMCSIAEMGYHNYLDIHLMTSLINTPFSRPDYIEKYGIETSRTQPFFHHRHIDGKLSNDTSNFVTRTNSFTTDEWIEGHQYRWLIMFGHYLGPTQFISRFLRKHLNVSYKEFYTSLLNYAKKNPSGFLGQHHFETVSKLKEVLENRRHWGIVIPELSEINWSFEEAMAIFVAMKYDDYESEMRDFLTNSLKINLDPDLIEDLLRYQKARLNYPGNSNSFHHLKYDLHGYIEGEKELMKRNNTLSTKSCGIEDYYTWAKKILWFGRRTGDYKSTVIKVTFDE